MIYKKLTYRMKFVGMPVSVKVFVGNAPAKKPCIFCGNTDHPLQKRLAVVLTVTYAGITEVSPRTEIGKYVRKIIRKGLMHHKIICDRESCREKRVAKQNEVFQEYGVSQVSKK